jgi:hypothetical protein
MKNHIRSIVSSRSILNHWASDWVDIFGEQELIHVEQIHIGGKHSYYTGMYEGAEKKYLMVAFPNVKDLPSYEQKWIIIDDLEKWEEENQCNVKEMNYRHLLANKNKWLVNIDQISSTELGNRPYIKPIQVDENREGLYGVYHTSGKLLYIVDMTKENMFAFFDKVKRYASNFSFQEMVDNGYLSMKPMMSWLGENGKNIHAVNSYFRKIGAEIVYYTLETWCAGNHWKSIEHSPIPKYPNTDEVTCKKCLKKMERLKKKEGAI